MRSMTRFGGRSTLRVGPARRLALAAGLVASMMLGACMSSGGGNDDVEVGVVEGSISGTVTDSRGTPVVGATLSYDEPTSDGATSEVSVITGADGSFVFEGVGITAATGPNGNDLNGPLTLSLSSPSTPVRTLDATITITPIAQVGAADLFAEGFVVEAGTIPVPALDKLVQGTLRSADSGAVLGDQTVHLTYKGIEFTPELPSGISLSYTLADNPSLVTDQTGAIAFAEAPNDSCLELLVSALAVESISGSSAGCGANTVPTRDPDALYFATATTPDSVQLGSVFVSGYQDSDSIAPYVSGVAGVLDSGVSPAPLSSSIDGVAPNGIQIQFSEPLQAGIGSDDVVVRYGSGGQSVAGIASVGLSNNSLVTINLSAPLPTGTTILVQLAREAFLDTAGNPAGASQSIAYDSLSGSSSQTLTLTLGTAASFDTVPPYVTGVSGVQDASVSPAPLSSSVTGQAPNELIMKFSEALGSSPRVDDVAVTVSTRSGSSLATVGSVSLSDGDSYLHITLRDPLPASATLLVDVARAALEDTAGNGVALNGALAYDSFAGSTGDLLRLSLMTPEGDTAAPYVAVVEGVLDASANPAPLSSTITGVAPNEFVIVFDEAVADQIDASAVRVVYGRLDRVAQIASLSLENAGTELHVALSEEIPAGNDLTLSITRAAVEDLAGNGVTLNSAIAYDAFTGSAADTLSLYLTTGGN